MFCIFSAISRIIDVKFDWELVNRRLVMVSVASLI